MSTTRQIIWQGAPTAAPVGTVHMEYVLVARDYPLEAIDPTHTVAWQKRLQVTNVPINTPLTVAWCRACILDANPDYQRYFIGITLAKFT